MRLIDTKVIAADNGKASDGALVVLLDRLKATVSELGFEICQIRSCE